MKPYRLNADEVSAAPPALPAHQPLRGHVVSLLPLTAATRFEQLYQCSHGDAARERIWDYLPYGPFPDADAMRDSYREMAAAGDPQFYIVRHHDGDSDGGIVSYLRMTPAAYSIEIGHIWHAAGFQRGRANTEAAYLLIRQAFELGYRRLEWKCNALNRRSRQAALRLGLAYEGIFRQHSVFKGKNRDTAWFALLQQDWPAVRQNIEQWLAADAGACSLTALNRPLVEWTLAAHEQYR